MKSMSWFLHENESSVLRECQACGFSTRSPSIYRRHSRHCDVDSSATLSSQESNGLSLALDFPSISSKPSVDFPSVDSKPAMDIPNVSSDFPDVGSQMSVDFPDDHSAVGCMPSVDFPDVSCEHSVGFRDIISQSAVISDKLLVSDANRKLDDDGVKGTVPSVEETAVPQPSLKQCETLMCEVDPMLLVLADPSQSSTSTPADSSFHLTPVNPRSLSPGSVATSALDGGSQSETRAAKIPPDVVDDLNSADDGDDVPSLNCASEVGAAEYKNKSDCSLVHNDASLSDNTADHDTEGIHDELHDDSKVVDSPESSDQLETLTAGNTAPANKSRDDTSPGLTSGKTQAKLKKSAPSRKSSTSPSKQRRCKHCKLLLSSRLERRNHMQSKHADLIPVFRCGDCNYCSTEHKNYERHLLRHLLTGPFCCTLCTFSSTSQSSIKRHVALQHNQSQTTADSGSAPKSSEISTTVSELPSTVSSPVGNRSDAELVSSPSDVTFGDSLPSESNDCKKPKLENVNDSHGSTSEMENCESKADVDCTTLKEAALPDSSKDMIQPVIEVEVRSFPGEDGGEGETWWICLSCGARYDERAKVRRHVKCKHHIPLTQCRVHDLRSTPSSHHTSISSSSADDLIKQLQEARASSSTVQASTKVDQHSATSEQTSVKAGDSLVSPGVKLQPKSFVKIAPKPLQLDGSCQIVAAPATAVINSKRQVVLPKCNWKQKSLSLPTANNVPESSSAVKDLEAGMCDMESELRRHLTQDLTDDKKLSSPVVQPVTSKEPENGISPSLTPAAQEVPKKKRKLILRAKTNRTSQGRCDSAVNESSDSLEKTQPHPECAEVLPSEHADDVKEHSSEMEDTTTEEPVSKVSATSNEQSKKASATKRQFRIKRTSPLKCAHCQFTAYRLPDLRRHLLEHTGDRVYECGRCSRTFRNKIGLYLHEQRKHKADLTPLTSTSPTDESAQTAADTEQTSVKTEEVDGSGDIPKLKKARSRNRSQKSSLGSRSKPKLKEQSASEVEKSTGNDEDGNESATADADEKHREKKDRSTSKRCTETVELVQSPDRSDHFKIVIRRQSIGGEEILETIAGVNDGMMCKFCGYTAKIPVQLSQHMKIHTGERDYWCTIDNCTYRTIWRCDMKRHFRKFHPDEVEHHGGNYYELLQSCYRPSKLNDQNDSSLPTESSSSTVSVIKMSKRQRRRLLKLQSKEQSKRSKKEVAVGNKLPQEEASSVMNASDVASDTGEHLSSADSEAKKENFGTKSVERFRPYKCSECGRRSNWRWDLKKHILAKHKNAVVIKLNSDVARATFADIYLSHGGRNGIRFPRSQALPDVSMSKGSLPNCDGESKTEESGAEPDGKKPVSELEKTLSRAPAPVKSIGMIDMLRLKRFQCSGCPYRSDHRGDLGRHIRMRHGRGNCTISVLSADVAAATLQAYRLQWNRKKAWLPKRDSLPSTQPRKIDRVKTFRKFCHGSRSAEKDEIAGTMSETVEDAEKSAAEAEGVNEASIRKQSYKEFWYLDDEEDETKCCDMCPFKTDRTGLLELHKLRHRAPAAGTSSGSVTYSCPHCPYFVRTSRQLERHMALHEDTAHQHHDDPLPISGGVQHISSCSSGKTRYVCEKCPFVSMFRNEFWLHRRHHFVPKVDVPYSCDLCPFWASDRRTLSEHHVLHTQSYYPRLSVPVVSRYRAANVQSNDDGTGDGNCSREVTAMTSSESEVVAEVDDSIQAQTSLSRDDRVEMENCPQLTGGDDEDMEVENCPMLEAVDQLMASVSEMDIPECCPLLEPECEQCFLESSIRERFVTFPALTSENPELTLPSGTGAESVDLGSGEVLLKDNGVVALSDGIPARESTTEVSNIPTLSAESVTTVLRCSDIADVMTSDGDSDLMKYKNDLSDDTVSFSDQTDSRSLKYQVSDCQPPDACLTPFANSPILTSLSGAVESSVMASSDDGSLKDSQTEVLGDDLMSAVCSDSVNTAEVIRCESSGVNSTNDNTAASDAGNDLTDSACLMSDVSCYQSLEALRDGVSDSTHGASCDDGGLSKDDEQPAVDHAGSGDADGLVKSNVDVLDDEKSATDCTESGEIQAKVSREHIPDACSVGEDAGVVESISLDADRRCDDDGLPKNHIDASDAGKAMTDLSEGEECRAKAEVSRDHIPDASSVGEDGGKVESKSLDDVPCRCALQCQYCFFAIASVRLLRQHMVFHVAVSDAASSPVFQPQLDSVEDGRVDDVRCEHLVRLCNRCRHLAELDSPVVIPETADALVGWGNCDPVWGLGNAGGVTVSELAEKTAFLSQLSLAACPMK